MWMIESAKKKMAVWWSIWRHARFAAYNTFCSIACYAVGLYHSSATSSVPLARAGAAATAFAIGFTLYNYGQALAESEERANRNFAKVTKNLPLTGAASQQRIEAQTRRNTRIVVSTTNVWQAIVLIVATLVWGFGDMANELL